VIACAGDATASTTGASATAPSIVVRQIVDRVYVLCQGEVVEEGARLSHLRDRLQDGMLAAIGGVKVNGAGAARVPGTVNVCIDGVEGESLLLMLDARGIAASSGSACTSGSLEPSHVLMAMGVRPELAHGSLRLSLGRATIAEDVDAVLEVLPPVVERLRSIAPGLSRRATPAPAAATRR